MKKKYHLNAGEDFDTSLIFWIRHFLHHKMLCLSTRLVRNMELYKTYLNAMKEAQGMPEIKRISLDLVKIDFDNLTPYFCALRMLYNTLSINKFTCLNDISEEDINELFIINNHLANITKKIYKNTILSFFRYIEDNNIENYHFGINLNLRHINNSSARIPRYLNQSELKRIIDNLKDINDAKTAGQRFIFSRDRLLIKLLIFSGMRCCEIMLLKESDIAINDKYFIITIYGKFSKYRRIAISRTKIETEYSDYLAERNKVALPHFKYLFMGKHSQRLTRSSIYCTIKKALKKNNLLANYKNGAHVLRHSYASLIYQESNDIVLLQRLLGHSSIETTRIYTHIDERTIQIAADYLQAI